MFQDSFFAPDSRLDSLGNSEFASLAFANPRTPPRSGNGHDMPSAGARNGVAAYEGKPDEVDDTAGVVIDAPATPLASRSHH